MRFARRDPGSGEPVVSTATRWLRLRLGYDRQEWVATWSFPAEERPSRNDPDGGGGSREEEIMNEIPSQPGEAQGEPLAPVMAEGHGPFGPRFFIGHLMAFVRERCPDPAEGLPVVLLHLMDGEVLDVCHVMGLAPDFVALAVRDNEREAESRAMRTELLPYESIHRITVRTGRPAQAHVGFAHGQVPRVITTDPTVSADVAEKSLRAAGMAPPLVGRAAGTSKAGARPHRRERGVKDAGRR